MAIVQQEQLRVGPNVARIRGNEKGQVANQAHALRMCVFPEPFALAEQQELREAHPADLIRQFASDLLERRRLALDQLCRPFEVIRVVEPGF